MSIKFADVYFNIQITPLITVLSLSFTLFTNEILPSLVRLTILYPKIVIMLYPFPFVTALLEHTKIDDIKKISCRIVLVNTYSADIFSLTILSHISKCYQVDRYHEHMVWCKDFFGQLCCLFRNGFPCNPMGTCTC